MALFEELAPLPAEAAVRRLLRNHPKVHPASVAAAELKALGLGDLPLLEWDVEQPWGQYLEGASPRLAEDAAYLAAAQAAPLSPPLGGFVYSPPTARTDLVSQVPLSYASPVSYAAEPFQAPVPVPSLQVPLIHGFQPMLSAPIEQPVQAPGSIPQPEALPAQAPGPGNETLRLAELEAEERLILEEVLSLDRRQGVAVSAQPPPTSTNSLENQGAAPRPLVSSGLHDAEVEESPEGSVAQPDNEEREAIPVTETAPRPARQPKNVAAPPRGRQQPKRPPRPTR